MNRVYLVGAGPGDPELLTVKALFLLRKADVVLHDALISPEILKLISTSAKVIDVGKRCGQKLLTQEEINSLLVHHGKRAEITVRLKGGDPTIFGRVGEEIQALRQAGIDYEIVPGITSALAGAAAAGISLTDRRFASSVVFATAHRGPGTEGVEWDRLVSSQSTLVIYMPGRDYRGLSQQLSDAGLDASTPCAIVSCAGRNDQKVLLTALERIGESSPLPAPSILLVGRCAVQLDAEDYSHVAIQASKQFEHQDPISL
jgi:uroporphyrin-III C-methyltransferase